MCEDSSSDGEWRDTTESQAYSVHAESTCWECGKTIRDLNSLMFHYRSHNIEATCHICKITFRRLTSLSTHLENAHLPPSCFQCRRFFHNVWDLNKHAKTHLKSSASFQNSLLYKSNSFAKQATEQQSAVLTHHNSHSLSTVQEVKMKQKNKTSENGVKTKAGKDDKNLGKKSCSKKTSSPSSSKHGKAASAFSSKVLKRSGVVEPTSSESSGKCSLCDRGPFRSLKQHWRYCTGKKMKYPCIICKKVLPSKADLRVHHMPLHLCHSCGQVFPSQAAYSRHQCRNAGKSTLVLFCSESMPKVCNICKSFFISEKTLSIHVTKVHTSVVSTKICVVTDPSLLTEKREGAGSTKVQSLSVPRQAVNGGGCLDRNQEASLPSVLRSDLSSLLAAPLSGMPPAPVSTSSLVHQIANQIFGPSPPGTSGLLPHNMDSEHDYSTGTILFENKSRQAALKKHVKSGWRSKAPHPCRHCGAILRQPSSIISHRYLHRGQRLHRCQCGRAFKHRLHLLRHCIRHAEASNYICATCGETFTGAKLLAQHVMGNPWKKSRSGRLLKSPEKNKCSMPFLCDCGQLFLRPSAYIWHQLKNWTKNE
ncbi:zinc finger protein 594 [Kryptolebias marmoratus]|uniref:Zinc finger protein 594-like n=1 Tax=Kryptolebias marmoratus TaxID=37003 RepID=A0A3Q3FZF5_KRYMA|nr:zinc finger protein 594 [Kryptolebias marmoratus]XP_017295169.1 zinc finger protein 594 [Kryptolebias marmoratus]XP_037836357.1 zinc finger protein 594 [Kryptolebias marmoratus]